jgi:hypothetical protein
VLYGFPGERPDDYRTSLELASILTHLDPPTGCGPIRLDRFSPNFDHAKDMGFLNVRPLEQYKYIYPFDMDTLYNLAYYFNFDYQETIDDGGYVAPLIEAILRWKRSQDQLYTRYVGHQLVIFDSRPVATSPQVVLTDIGRYVYEYCDHIRSIRQIEQWLSELGGMPLSREQVVAILDEFVAKKLMVQEGNRYLSLAIMTYTADFEVTQRAAGDKTTIARHENILVTV